MHFTHVLMDNCNVRWNIDAAILLCCGKTKHVVIFVDGSAYCTKGVVAVGQYIWQWEFFHSGCLCCLDNTNECDIMGCHCIEFKF